MLDRSRLDFDLPDPPPQEEIEAALNALIAADHPVTTEWVDEAVLDANPGLVRTLSVQPPRGAGRLRLVRIGVGETPVDLQPCGGTHVARTGEIGRVQVREDREQGQAEPAHHHRAGGVGRASRADRREDRVGPLVTTDWLAAELGKPDLVVFDATKYLPNETKDGQTEFLRRAYPRRAVSSTSTRSPTPTPTCRTWSRRPGRFARLVGALGVVATTRRVVFYDQKGLASAARGWWLMGLFGHDNAAVLDGGLPKWRAEGRAVETGAPPPPAPASFRPDFRPTRLRGIGDVLAQCRTRAELVLDARAAGRFTGDGAGTARRACAAATSPARASLPYTDLLNPDGTFRSPADAARPLRRRRRRRRASGGDQLRLRRHRLHPDPGHAAGRAAGGRRL